MITGPEARPAARKSESAAAPTGRPAAAGETERRPRHRRSRGADPVPVWLVVVVALVAIYLILPTLFVVPMSFGSTSTFAFPPQGFSLRNYQSFFTDPRWLASLRNSVVVAVLASLLATTVGTAAAVGLHHLRGRAAAQFVRTILMIPLVAPAIVVAVAVYISFLKWQLVGSLGGYVLAHAAIGVPFVLVSVTSALGGFDAVLLRASASLGASPARTFRRVTMPLIGRGILSGAVFAFVTSFDEVVIALFLRAPEFQTMPVQMYNSVTYELDPTMAAASSLVVIAVTLICFVAQFLGGRNKTR
ncbi:MAG: ABC transporter permease [Propionibacteriaceae bacterium]